MQGTRGPLANGGRRLQACGGGSVRNALVPMPTELRVLGDLAVNSDGESRSVGGPKAQMLLSVLVAHRRTRMSVDRLIEAIWDDEPPRTATATIQTQISRLRSVLAPSFTVTHEAGGYQLEPLDGEIDSDRFESLLAESRTLGTNDSVVVLDSALSLWRGPAFGRFAELPEVCGAAVRLDELRLVATDEWAEAKMATGDPAQMVGELEALVDLHPLRECYWRLLMLALYRSGRQAEALRRASEFRSALREQVGLDLSPTVRELEAKILADDPSLSAARDSSSEYRNTSASAPQLLGATSFVGRDPDLASLTDALAHRPLITITGPGGVGKTRLAMRAAATLVDEFEDGVTVVEFAALRDPAGVAQVIAHALDVQQRQHRTIETTIEEYLAPTRLLLLLDNCEHVVEAVAPLVDRLRSTCPGLKILATSRQPLGLAGEYIEVLTPLAVPNSGVDLTSEIARCAAVELFVARATATTPGFALTDDNAVAVADICRRLDGIPLALELAAARLRTMGVDALAVALDQRIEMLGQTQRGADGRQRTLHELVRWSHDLLDPDDRHMFDQLAIFAGGFDLSAADSVCRVGEGQASAVGHIASLVDKSMVVLVDPDFSRYRLLEPLREFGLDRLRDRGELEATENRHLQWFVDLAERGSTGLDTAEESAWSAALDRDFDNFRAAHLTAVRRLDVDNALSLVGSLREYAFRRVRYEVTSWADVSTTLVGAEDNPTLPTVLAVSAYGSFVKGDTHAAVELARRALDASGGSGLSESGLPERSLGNALFYQDRIDEALVWTDRMVLSARRSGSSARIAHALYMRSVAQTVMGDGIRGAALAGEAKAAADTAGSLTAHAQADYALGLALESTEPTEALSLLERASLLGAEAGNRWIEAFALTEVHSLRARQGENLEALAGYADVVDIWYRGGDWANQWLSLKRVLLILVELGAFEAAAVLHGALTAMGAALAQPFEATDAERLQQGVDEVRSLLGPATFADAVRRGASMRDREIVSFVKQQIATLTGEAVS